MMVHVGASVGQIEKFDIGILMIRLECEVLLCRNEELWRPRFASNDGGRVGYRLGRRGRLGIVGDRFRGRVGLGLVDFVLALEALRAGVSSFTSFADPFLYCRLGAFA